MKLFHGKCHINYKMEITFNFKSKKGGKTFFPPPLPQPIAA